MLEPRRKSRTLPAELADTLGQRIRNQEYAPGTKLPKEMDMMEESEHDTEQSSIKSFCHHSDGK